MFLFRGAELVFRKVKQCHRKTVTFKIQRQTGFGKVLSGSDCFNSGVIKALNGLHDYFGSVIPDMVVCQQRDIKISGQCQVETFRRTLQVRAALVDWSIRVGQRGFKLDYPQVRFQDKRLYRVENVRSIPGLTGWRNSVMELLNFTLMIVSLSR
jgi:hypothetical protein